MDFGYTGTAEQDSAGIYRGFGLLAIGFRQVTVDRAHRLSRRTTAETSVACRAVPVKLHGCAADEGSGMSFV